MLLTNIICLTIGDSNDLHKYKIHTVYMVLGGCSYLKGNAC